LPLRCRIRSELLSQVSERPELLGAKSSNMCAEFVGGCIYPTRIALADFGEIACAISALRVSI
jgi:hypothetical protein